MKRLLLIIFLFLLFVPAPARGADLYEEQLDRGLRNSEAYSYLLIERSKANPVKAKGILTEALKYSPDLPAVYFGLSKVSFSFSIEGVLRSFNYMLEGIAAYQRNFWWFFTTVSSLYMSLILSFVISMTIIVFMRLIRNLPLLCHDIMEQKTKTFLLLILIFALTGPLFLIAGILIILGLYMEKLDRVVIYLYLLFLLISPWIFKTASMFLNAPASNTLRAAIQVNESKDNRYALAVLEGRDEEVALFSYALALKREGRYDEAIAIYDRLIAKKPMSKLYNNIANCYFAKNDMERAKKLYEKSIELEPLVPALYNLSQVSRKTRDFIRGEDYFLTAKKLDSEAVSRFQAILSWNPNRFVIDEALSLSTLLKYAKENTASDSTMGVSAIPLSAMPVIALFLGILFLILDRRIKSRAYRCKKCGTIFCNKCERRLPWGHMCPKCYSSLVKLDELDARERAARLKTVYEYQMRRRRKIKILSFILPGSAQIYGGNILKGLLFLWPFLFLLFTFVISSVFVVGMPYLSHLWLNMVSLFLLAIVYVISIIAVRRRLAKRWL